MAEKEIQELKEALEYQIDVVLKLEDERQMLSQENKLQREQIKNLNQMLEKYIGFQQLNQIDKAVQSNLIADMLTQETQTDSPYDIQDSAFSLCSLTQSQISEQKIPTNKSKKTSNAITYKKQPLKFCGDDYIEKKKQQQIGNNKENQSKQQTSTDKALQQQQQSGEKMAEEILRLNKELHQQKYMMRENLDKLKKIEKENLELTRIMEVKNQTLEKIRNENLEMGLLINDSKLKSISGLSVNNFKQKVKELQDENKTLKKSLDQMKSTNEKLEQDQSQMKNVLTKLTYQYEKLIQKESTKQVNNESELKVQQLMNEVKFKTESIKELKQVNEEISSEIEYFKSIGITSKQRCEKLEEDISFYRKLLKDNNIKIM